MSEQQYNTNPPKIDIPDNVLESAGFIGSGKLKFREYSLGFIKELFEKSVSLANVDSINNIREVTGDHVREAAQKARDSIREKQAKKEKALRFDSKLADCFSKDRKKCEIYITEGDSASGNMKTARDNEFQAVLPVRGKILNTHKAGIDKIQKNAEIMTMMDAFGLEIDPKTMKVSYDKNKIRYGKIIIMSDADVDGAHIKNLFYTFIWNFCPQLIEDGFVYAGVPPLYKITTNKGYKYIRIIRQVTINDANAARKLFDDLMGTAVTPRKAYIKEHSEEAQYNAE